MHSYATEIRQDPRSVRQQDEANAVPFPCNASRLSNWLVNKAKVEPKTVQGILRHAEIETTLDLYTQDDNDETLAAQGEYLTALGVDTHMVQ